METIGTLSSYEIIQRVQTRFRIPNAGWHADAIDFIAEGAKEIGYHIGFISDIIDCTVEDFRTLLPSHITSINSITYNGIPLVPALNKSDPKFRMLKNYQTISVANDMHVADLNSEHKRLKELQTLYLTDTTDTVLDAIVDAQQKIKLLVENLTFSNNSNYLGADWYRIEGKYLKTSFSDGIVLIDADCQAVDDEGFPMIPDSQKYVSAIEWWLMYNLMLQGHQHPVLTFEFVYNECFNVKIPQARNEPKMLSPQRQEIFTEGWNSIKRDIHNVTLKSDL